MVWSVPAVPRGVIASARECPWRNTTDFLTQMMNDFVVGVYCRISQIRFLVLTRVILV